MRYLLIVLLFPLFSEAKYSLSNSAVTCEHFWIKNEQLIASGKTVGIDVGESGYGPEGLYQCSMKLPKEDLLKDKYLFIGEVADASFLEVTQINGKKQKGIVETHGLQPHFDFETRKKNARFTFLVPFIVPISNIYKGEGEYRFSIRYMDLLPGQVGLKTGPVLILSFYEILKRIGTSKISFHVFQIIFLISLLFLTLLLRQENSRLRRLTGLIISFSALSLLQFTGFIRYFIEPTLALALNYDFQILSFYTSFLWFSLVLRGKVNFLRRLIFPITILLGTELLFSTLFSKVIFRNYHLMFSPFFILVGVGVNVLISVRLMNKSIYFFDSTDKKSSFRGFLLLLATIVFSFDIVNWLFLFSRFSYFSHYFIFSFLSLLAVYSNLIARKDENSKLVLQVSHDIRSPLAALSTILKSIQGIPTEEKELAEKSVHRIQGIAEQLLEANRAKTNKKKQVKVLIEEVIEEKKKLTSNCNFIVDAEIKQEFDKAFAVNFQRLLSNLLQNSIESLAHEGTIIVTCKKVGGNFEVAIQDNGIGIPPDVLGAIRDRKTVTFGKKKGNGIGLEFVREQIDSWGGTFEITSELGKGTCVRFTFFSEIRSIY